MSETMSCCGGLLGGYHSDSCEESHEDQGTTTWGYTLAKALGISGLYGYDEALEVEREATAWIEEAT